MSAIPTGMVYVCPCSKCICKRKKIKDKPAIVPSDAPLHKQSMITTINFAVTDSQPPKARSFVDSGYKMGCFGSFYNFKRHLVKVIFEEGEKKISAKELRCPFDSCEMEFDAEKYLGDVPLGSKQILMQYLVEHVMDFHFDNVCYCNSSEPWVAETGYAEGLKVNALSVEPKNYKRIIGFIETDLMYPCNECLRVFHDKSFLVKHLSSDGHCV